MPAGDHAVRLVASTGLEISEPCGCYNVAQRQQIDLSRKMQSKWYRMLWAEGEPTASPASTSDSTSINSGYGLVS
jgi:hypothetical protein